MKKIILSFAVFFICISVNAQGASISLKKKIKQPVELSSGQVLKIGDEIRLLEGKNQDGSFRFVQLLNNFNEPIQLADSRAAYKIQEIKFFKEQDGSLYLFTKYFCVHIEPAIINEEIEL